MNWCYPFKYIDTTICSFKGHEFSIGFVFILQIAVVFFILAFIISLFLNFRRNCKGVI